MILEGLGTEYIARNVRASSEPADDDEGEEGACTKEEEGKDVTAADGGNASEPNTAVGTTGSTSSRPNQQSVNHRDAGVEDSEGSEGHDRTIDTGHDGTGSDEDNSSGRDGRDGRDGSSRESRQNKDGALS